MLRFLALALLAACAGAAEPATPEAAPQPRLSLPLELADAGSQAVMLWKEQGAELPQVGIDADADGGIEVVMLHGVIHGCGGAASAWGCTEMAVFRGDSIRVLISDETPPELLVSVIAHELGHAQGFAHTADGQIMDPNRQMLPTCVFDSCLR